MHILLLKTNENIPFIITLLLIARGIGVFVCAWKAMQKNREPFGWGAFGLLFPIVAMIWIHKIKAKPGNPKTLGTSGYGSGPGYRGGYDGGHNNRNTRSKEGYKGNLYKK